MRLLRTERLPEGPDWLYEVKLDCYRALAVKSGGNAQLRSRNDNDFSTRYARLTKALNAMPDETVIDGEIVALDKDGKPSFNALQNYGSSSGPMLYYVFDLLILSGRDVMGETLDARRALLDTIALGRLMETARTRYARIRLRMSAGFAISAVVSGAGFQVFGLRLIPFVYSPLVAIFGLLAYGLFRFATNALPVYSAPADWQPQGIEVLGVLLIMRAFASGAVARSAAIATS